MKKFKGIVLAVVLFVSQNVFAIIMDQRVLNFIEGTKKRQYGTFFERGTVTDAWILKAVGVILNGQTMREANIRKSEIIDQVTAMADAVIGAPLRNNQNITDAQYNSITLSIENRIKNLVSRLSVDSRYLN